MRLTFVRENSMIKAFVLCQGKAFFMSEIEWSTEYAFTFTQEGKRGNHERFRKFRNHFEKNFRKKFRSNFRKKFRKNFEPNFEPKFKTKFKTNFKRNKTDDSRTREGSFLVF